MLYIIKMISKHDGEQLYWNNQMGWVDRELADVFTEDETFRLDLPLDGAWVSADDEEEETA